MKIKKNFLVISSFKNDLTWVPEYTTNYLIYERGGATEFPSTIDPKKILISPNVGYNSYDYFRFIVDNYDNLPDCTIFAKGHAFPRHVSKAYFDQVVNNEYFTPLEDTSMHHPEWPSSFFSAEGGFCEINNSWYLEYHPTKYFHTYNDFLRFCFKNPVIPRYTRFAPGGDYIVPKANILKLPKQFYENLKTFVSHHQVPGETHIIERAMHTLWTCNFEINDSMLKPIDDSFVAVPLKYSKRQLARRETRIAQNIVAHRKNL